MKKPTMEQLDVAIMWLESYDKESDGYAACQAVADYLGNLMSKETANMIRTMLKNGYTTEQIIKIASEGKP